MFGEMIGAWLLTCWRQLDRPAPLRLVELGPGRGQLMADVVRTIGNVSDIGAGIEIHLVESSRRLREVQRAKLEGLAVTWHDGLETVPEGPFALIANEFFRRAAGASARAHRNAGWAERLITSDEGGGLTFAAGDASAALQDIIPNAAMAPHPA